MTWYSLASPLTKLLSPHGRYVRREKEGVKKKEKPARDYVSVSRELFEQWDGEGARDSSPAPAAILLLLLPLLLLLSPPEPLLFLITSRGK